MQTIANWLGRNGDQAVQAANTSIVASRSRSLSTRFLRSRRAVIGLTVLVLVALGTIVASSLISTDPMAMNPRIRMIAPMGTSNDGTLHLLGTDAVGRDVASRVVFGGKVSLGVTFAAVFLGGSVGVLLGLLCGYYGGTLDTIIMRIADVQLAIPTVLLAIGVVAMEGQSLTVLILVLAISTWIIFARTIRGSVLTLKEAGFVEAARAAGASDQRILFQHILPNAWAPVIVVGTQQVAFVLILESGLSFIGAGAPANMPSWGTVVTDGKDYILTGAWWLTTSPGLAISVTALAVNFLGDGLRDAFDPRLRL